MEQLQHKFILGIRVDDVSLDQAAQRCADFLRSGKKAIVVTPNPEICVYGYSRKWYRKILEEADLAIPDGFGLKVGGLMLEQPITHTTTGSDLTERLLALAEHKGYSVAFLGGREGIGGPLIESLHERYPKLAVHHVAGGQVSVDGESDDPEVFKKINTISPHILFVCLGHPKQETFMVRNKARISAGLLVGVGGTIDFLARRVKRAPSWMRSAGFEWLYRLVQEPRRIVRIFTAVVIFPIYCLRWIWGTLFIYRPNVAAVILNDRDQVLICKHAIYGYWQIPQGGVGEEESLESAVLRELKEEVGTDNFDIIGYKKNAYKYRWPPNSRNFRKYKNRGQQQTIFLLRFRGTDAELKLDQEELSEFTWMSKDAILQSSLIPDYKKIIIKIGLSLMP